MHHDPRLTLSLGSEPSGPGGRTVVLLVEDDRELREAVADLLELEGYGVAEAENGLDALLHLRTATRLPDLILMDLDMPLMSGWEFREAQRRDPLAARIPVVVISSHTAEGLDVDGVVPKTCHPERLLGALEQALASARQRSEEPAFVSGAVV